PPPSGACTASVSLNTWTGGFVATVRVTAGSAGLSRWSVNFGLPSGTTLVNTWNAQPSGSSGNVTFRNMSYNGTVSPGTSTEFGFQGNGNPPTGTPTCSAS
ncbi:1,4-beta-xylanase, partial [Micromonospora craterilacus]